VAEYAPTGELVAFKEHIPGIRDGDLELEADLLEALPHPNIMPLLYRSQRHEPEPFIVMPILDHANSLNLAEIMHVLHGVAEGIDYAHSNGVLHRDVKPANFFVGQYGQGVLGDFSVGCWNDNPRPGVGDPSYSAPEARHQRLYLPESDIYSFALSARDMVTTSIGYIPTLDSFCSLNAALAIDPVERTKSAQEFIAAFEAELYAAALLA